MANILKKAAAGLLDKMFAHAEVKAVRAWQPATMYEIDVHFPTASMEKWNTIRRVKCRVGELEYRDYTPAVWNAASKTFTMYIEAGHNGAGSRWVQQLQQGDEIMLGPVHAAPVPAKEGKILCLGDGSALGHFLALGQLTERESHPMEAAILLHDQYKIPATLLAEHPGFEFFQGNGAETLEQWYAGKDLGSYTSIYIAGHIPTVSALRKKLKNIPEVTARIYAHGFWS